MKPLVVYHAQCMDGAAAALAAWLRFGDEAEYRPASYGDPAPMDEEVRGRDVYVLDFSYPRAKLERLSHVCNARDGETCERGEVVVLDHHKTAQADLAGLPFCTFDMSKSGAVLAWEHFHVRKREPRQTYVLPELFAYVQDRDLWRWELPHSREVSAALTASGALADFRKLIPIYEGWEADAHALRHEGAAILRAERLQVERIAATAEEVEIVLASEHVPSTCERRGYSKVTSSVRALAATSAVLQSEVGEALALESARRGRDAVGVVYYRDGAIEKWRVSLRSRDRRGSITENPRDLEAPDVSAVAKAFGGGGHAQAAGFECERLPWWPRR